MDRISNFPGSHKSASISPDGNWIVFADDAHELPQLWIKNLNKGNPIQITSGSEPADYPRWSPNNDQIIFCRGSFQTARELESIWTIPPLGGKPHKLIDAGRNPNWSGDGKKIVFERNAEIWTANSDGTNQEKVQGVPEAALLIGDRYPSLSPNGENVSFFQPRHGPEGEYYVIPTKGGSPAKLTNGPHAGGNAVWSADGKSIIFPATIAGSMTLWEVDTSGRNLKSLTTGAGFDSEPTISPDGTKIIFTNTKITFTLKLYDPKTNISRDLFESRDDIIAPEFSPDGKKIAFFSGNDLLTISPDGTEPTPVLQDHAMNTFPRWSSDGSKLYFYRWQENSASYRQISIDGGQSIELIPGWSWEINYGAHVSPEDRLVLYSKRDKGNLVATYIRDLSTGAEKALPVALDDPRWSRDGKWIAGYDIVHNLNNNILVCDSRGVSCRVITKGLYPLWSSDDSHLFFQRKGTVTDGMELWSIRLDGTEEKKTTELRPMLDIAPFFSVSPSDEIAWIQFHQGKHELWMLQLASN
jgi:Tol biopolymer transport system component